MKKLYSLQVCRAAAAIAVVLYHVTDQAQKRFGDTFAGGAFLFGYTGVDFFFVLSGFIIYFAHVKDIGNRGSFSAYAIKRLIRIYPIYLAVFGAKLLSMGLFPHLATAGDTGVGYIIKSAFLFPQPTLPLVAPAWTLSYELLFYLLFGIGLWFGRRTLLYIAAIWGGLVLLYSLASLAAMPLPRSTFWLGFLLNERNLEFLLGCMAAAIVLQRSLSRRWLQSAVIVGILLLLGWATYVNIRQGREVASFTATFGLASFLIVLGLAGLEMQTQFKVPKSLAFLGDASYSLYLTQLLFLNAYFLLLGLTDLDRLLQPFWISCLGLLFTIAGGGACYAFVERPMLRSLRRLLLMPSVQTKLVQPQI